LRRVVTVAEESMKNKVTAAAVLFSSCWLSANAADTYAVDANHTHVTFSFNHLGFSTFYGKIPAKSGTITLDSAQKTGAAEVVFDLDEIATGVDKFDDHLESKDFFDTDKHPTATFKATKFTFDGEQPATIVGDLTIKGVTKPVTLNVTGFKCGQHPMAKVPACGANAKGTIKRSDFGLTYALPAVPDEIGLDIEIEAMKK
jgi:polyisoprenoid-binding protein YceI